MAEETDTLKQGLFGSPKGQPAKKPGSAGLGGLFGSAKSKEPDLKESMASLSSNVNDLNRRAIVLEERSADLRKKLQVAEQNMISDFKKVHHEVRTSGDEILDIKKEVDDIKAKIMLIIKELQLTAQKEDVDTLKKYINLWEPVNFVTQNEVERIVKDAVEAEFRDMNIKIEEEKYIEKKVEDAVKKALSKNK